MTTVFDLSAKCIMFCCKRYKSKTTLLTCILLCDILLRAYISEPPDANHNLEGVVSPCSRKTSKASPSISLPLLGPSAKFCSEGIYEIDNCEQDRIFPTKELMWAEADHPLLNASIATCESVTTCTAKPSKARTAVRIASNSRTLIDV